MTLIRNDWTKLVIPACRVEIGDHMVDDSFPDGIRITGVAHYEDGFVRIWFEDGTMDQHTYDQFLEVKQFVAVHGP